MNSLRIAEIYQSLQGEGEHTGTPSVFVRTTGCNLRCSFCDTPFTSWNPEGEQRSVEDIVRQVAAFSCDHVVLTGGEPLLQPGVVPLTEALRSGGHYLTIETAGTIYRPVQADLMSISPKRANSTPQNAPEGWTLRHESDRDQPEVIRRMLREFPYQLKFVIDGAEDIPDVAAWLARFPEADSQRVWLMPQAVTREALREKSAWLEPAALAAGYRFTSRWHVAEFDNIRGR